MSHRDEADRHHPPPRPKPRDPRPRGSPSTGPEQYRRAEAQQDFLNSLNGTALRVLETLDYYQALTASHSKKGSRYTWISHQRIADRIGRSRETVSRAVIKLREGGALETQRRPKLGSDWQSNLTYVQGWAAARGRSLVHAPWKVPGRKKNRQNRGQMSVTISSHQLPPKKEGYKHPGLLRAEDLREENYKKAPLDQEARGAAAPLNSETPPKDLPEPLQGVLDGLLTAIRAREAASSK